MGHDAAALQAATAADHCDTLEPWGIRALRPGPSANKNAANAANYGEARANPFPNLPQLLTAAVTPVRIRGTNRVSGAYPEGRRIARCSVLIAAFN